MKIVSILFLLHQTPTEWKKFNQSRTVINISKKKIKVL